MNLSVQEYKVYVGCPLKTQQLAHTTQTGITSHSSFGFGNNYVPLANHAGISSPFIYFCLNIKIISLRNLWDMGRVPQVHFCILSIKGKKLSLFTVGFIVPTVKLDPSSLDIISHPSNHLKAELHPLAGLPTTCTSGTGSILVTVRTICFSLQVSWS